MAYRYFATPRRRFIIADTPGHEQYTRNMVTGASTADLAVILVDARRGILPQTAATPRSRRCCASRTWCVAVNKMDLVGFDRAVFERIARRVRRPRRVARLRRASTPIPVSALEGDMVVDRGERLGWYAGPDAARGARDRATDAAQPSAALRFPVQLVSRSRFGERADSRGYLGRVEIGDGRASATTCVAWPSASSARVAEIVTLDGTLETAGAGRSVIAGPRPPGRRRARRPPHARAATRPRVDRRFGARLAWLDREPLDPRRALLVKHGTADGEGDASIASNRRLDIHDAAARSPGAATLAANDIGTRAHRSRRARSPLDRYADERATGSFLLIDEATNPPSPRA